MQHTPAHFEVATTIRSEPIPRIDDPLRRRCITDPARSRRELYIRLETWLSRFLWEAFREGRELESQRIAAEVYYVRHLRRHRGFTPNRWDLDHDRWIEEFVSTHYPR